MFIAEVGILVAWLNPPSFLQFLTLDGFSAHPFRGIVNAVLLGSQPKFFEILPLYIVLLSLLVVTLPLLRWPRLLLGGSVLLYVAARVFSLSLGPWTGGWFFNPLAWQVIFMVGVTSPYILKAENYWRGWDWLAALFSLFSLFESHAKHLNGHVPAALLIHFEVGKPAVHPFRLLAIVSLAWLAWRYIPATANWLRSRRADHWFSSANTRLESSHRASCFQFWARRYCLPIRDGSHKFWFRAWVVWRWSRWL